jgi:hypothetical protein
VLQVHSGSVSQALLPVDLYIDKHERRRLQHKYNWDTLIGYSAALLLLFLGTVFKMVPPERTLSSAWHPAARSGVNMRDHKPQLY